MKEDNVALVPKDNKIGVGTHFSIMLMDREKTEIKRMEMINRAVSDETAGEYVERISPLGSMIFGKGENDEIMVCCGRNKLYSGIIFDVDNDKHSCKTIDPALYQKSKKL